MPASATPSEVIQTWVRQHVGDVTWGARLDAPFGEARVQRVVRRDGPGRWIVKQHHAAAGHHAEVAALTALAPYLGADVPHLVASAATPRTLLLAEMPGDPADQRVNLQHEALIHAAAGRFLARLQAAPVDSQDPMPAEEAIARRLAGWLRRGALSPALHGLATDLVDPTSFTGARRVWAHRDFRPANWLWHDGRLGVLDFGHARPDVAMADLAKLAAGPWRERPALRTSFLRGYGVPWSGRLEAQLQSLCALHGLATASWGRRHGDQQALRDGEAVLVWCAERVR